MKQWWLSFVGEEGFRGVVVVEAQDFLEAVAKSHGLEINPGGQVQGCEVENFPSEFSDRLLSEEEVFKNNLGGREQCNGLSRKNLERGLKCP